MQIFGPVPSRRLGQSLGINHIPMKTCPYSCVYCQIGRTNHMRAQRKEFYKPEALYNALSQKLESLHGEHVDYLSFVPDGEPTLDVNLGRHIDIIKPFGIKTAVITNASLLWMDDVREDLSKADWVSVKIDAVRHDVWKRIDRAQGSLNLDTVLEGVRKFAREFKGELVTETMLVSGYNDDAGHLKEVADIVKSIHPSKACLLVPTRPPAEKDVEKPSVDTLQEACEIFYEQGIRVECVNGDEKDSFFFTDDAVNDLLSICAVHPVREDVVKNLLQRRRIDAGMINELVEKQWLCPCEYEGKKFYKRTY